MTGNTLLVFMADHGEEFLEHGQISHGKSLYEEQLHVPWIMRLDGVIPAGRRVLAPVELLDLAPTLLDLLGMEIPDALRGRSALPLLSLPESYRPERPTYAHLALGRTTVDEASVRVGKWKLVRQTPREDDAGTRRYKLFNLEADPAEMLDRWAQEPIVGGTLRQMLGHHQLAAGEASTQPTATEIDPETAEALEALGYLE